jgi:hypothetical protein
VDLRKKMAEADGIEDKATIARIFADIHEGTATKADILQHFQNGTIRSTETLNQALDRVDRIEQERKDGSGLLGDATLKKWQGLIEKLTSDDTTTNPFGSPGPSDEGMEAIHDLNMMVLDWEEKNPDASYRDRQEAINTFGNLIRDRIQLEPGQSKGGLYNPETGQAGGAGPDPTITPATPPETSTPASPQPAPQAQSESEAEWGAIPNPLESGRQVLDTLLGNDDEASDEPKGQDQVPPLDTLPQERREVIDTIAKQRGIDPKTVHQDIWRKTREMMQSAQPDIDPTTTNSKATSAYRHRSLCGPP